EGVPGHTHGPTEAREGVLLDLGLETQLGDLVGKLLDGLDALDEEAPDREAGEDGEHFLRGATEAPQRALGLLGARGRDRADLRARLAHGLEDARGLIGATCDHPDFYDVAGHQSVAFFAVAMAIIRRARSAFSRRVASSQSGRPSSGGRASTAAGSVAVGSSGNGGRPRSFSAVQPLVSVAGGSIAISS